jgi:hypothetical protein
MVKDASLPPMVLESMAEDRPYHVSGSFTLCAIYYKRGIEQA